MAEVLRLKEENKQLREKLHHLEGETKLTLLPESEISEKEKLTLKQDSSESDEENPPQGKILAQQMP